MGHQTGLSLGGSGSSVVLIMQPAFDVASGDIVLSVILIFSLSLRMSLPRPK